MSLVIRLLLFFATIGFFPHVSAMSASKKAEQALLVEHKVAHEKHRAKQQQFIKEVSAAGFDVHSPTARGVKIAFDNTGLPTDIQGLVGEYLSEDWQVIRTLNSQPNLFAFRLASTEVARPSIAYKNGVLILTIHARNGQKHHLYWNLSKQDYSYWYWLFNGSYVMAPITQPLVSPCNMYKITPVHQEFFDIAVDEAHQTFELAINNGKIINGIIKADGPKKTCQFPVAIAGAVTAAASLAIIAYMHTVKPA